jgi:thymidylate kinase
MPIICFFGSDGSGKSTVAEVLTKMLRCSGFTVKISWMRGTHTFSSVLARVFSKFSTFGGSDNPYYMISIPKTLRRLWQFLEFISMLPILFARFLLPSAIGCIVIAERYLPDFVAWVATTTNDPYYLKSPDVMFLLALTSKADVRVYVTADLNELKRRRNDSDMLFLQKQLELYEELANAVDAFKLDTTNKSVSESANALFDLVEQSLKKSSKWHAPPD